MKSTALAPPANCNDILPGYQFADAYATPCPPGMDAITATRKVFSSEPAWIKALMALRNKLVGPLGLKTGEAKGFPVLKETAEEVVLGFDDRHLDFRVAVNVPLDQAQPRQVVVTTIVRTHNLFGRSYLALIMPFHKMIVRRMVASVWAAHTA